MARRSFLKDPSIFADKVLALMCAVPEGTHLSCVDLTKGLHAYIKANKLRISNPEPEPKGKPTEQTPTKALESQEPVGIRGAPHGDILRQPLNEETGARQLSPDNSCGANTGTALGPTLAPSDTPQEEPLTWPRRCLDCFDTLRDRTFAKVHFRGFHNMSWQHVTPELLAEKTEEISK